MSVEEFAHALYARVGAAVAAALCEGEDGRIGQGKAIRRIPHPLQVANQLVLVAVLKGEVAEGLRDALDILNAAVVCALLVILHDGIHDGVIQLSHMPGVVIPLQEPAFQAFFHYELCHPAGLRVALGVVRLVYPARNEVHTPGGLPLHSAVEPARVPGRVRLAGAVRLLEARVLHILQAKGLFDHQQWPDGLAMQAYFASAGVHALRELDLHALECIPFGAACEGTSRNGDGVYPAPEGLLHHVLDALLVHPLAAQLGDAIRVDSGSAAGPSRVNIPVALVLQPLLEALRIVARPCGDTAGLPLAPLKGGRCGGGAVYLYETGGAGANSPAERAQCG
eukprot:scaffold3043_cov360-Prasinococcus_capsulatus_cf.AAC.18